MKKLILNLTDYEFEGRNNEMKLSIIKVNIKEELSALLRVNGVYDSGIEICDGVDIARQIKECQEDKLELSEVEHNLIKKVLDKLIKNEQFKLGGVRYEELMLRVFRATERPKKKEVKNA